MGFRVLLATAPCCFLLFRCSFSHEMCHYERIGHQFQSHESFYFESFVCILACSPLDLPFAFLILNPVLPLCPSSCTLHFYEYWGIPHLGYQMTLLTCTLQLPSSPGFLHRWRRSEWRRNVDPPEPRSHVFARRQRPSQPRP